MNILTSTSEYSASLNILWLGQTLKFDNGRHYHACRPGYSVLFRKFEHTLLLNLLTNKLGCSSLLFTIILSIWLTYIGWTHQLRQVNILRSPDFAPTPLVVTNVKVIWVLCFLSPTVQPIEMLLAHSFVLLLDIMTCFTRLLIKSCDLKSCDLYAYTDIHDKCFVPVVHFTVPIHT